jgi:hypothetical protein
MAAMVDRRIVRSTIPAITRNCTVTTYTFLSPEWTGAVRELRSNHPGNPTDSPGFVVNAIIVGVPFEPTVLELHSDHGPVFGWQPGLASDPQVTLRLDHALARELAMDPTLDLLAQAAASGALQIEGDQDALADWWRTRIGNDDLVALENDIRAITS